jgi:glutathione S-transferase
MNTLVGISYSPWSEKAKWGLQLSGLTFRYQEYLPMLGEPALRVRLRRPRGKVTVPILFTEDGPLGDSLAIVEWASAHAPNAIISPEHRDAIIGWNALSERALALGRERTTMHVARDPEALVESVPGFMGKLGPVSRAIGKAGARYLERKYAFSAQDDSARIAELREILTTLRAALAGGDYLIGGELTYADVTMAVGLQFVSPPERNRLYAAHRRPTTG